MAEDKRTRPMTFSSEQTIVKRWFGGEQLDHSPGAVRMDFLKSGRAPLLLNHNPREQVGVVDSARIGNDKKGHAVSRFGRGPLAIDALGNVDDEILVNTSVGYRVYEMRLVSSKDGEDVYRIIDWEPYEVSLVAVPADPVVGVGRGDAATRAQSVFNPAVSATSQESTHVPEEKTAAAGENAETRVEATRSEAPNPVKLEQDRKDAIQKFCRANRLDERHARNWIESGADLNKVADDILAILAERGRTNPESGAFLDMSASEKRRYSLMRALRAATNKDWKDAGLELEANKAISKRLNQVPKSATSFFVPLDVMMRDLPNIGRRDMTAAGVSGSNYLIGTDNQPGSFIDLLRNTSVALRMGVTRLTGLQGNVTIPKMTAGNTAYWLADETTQITESQPTIGQLALAPKNVAALTELSHQLMQQSSPDAEQLVLTSIARDIGLAVDVGVLRGSGSSGQPTGIATTGSIGAFTGTSLAAAGLLNAIADVGAANALLPGCGFATTHAVAALLMDRPNVTSATDGTPLWQGRMEEGTIRGYPAMASGQMSAATMLFGCWPTVVLAEWGVLELMVNPFSDFTRGLTAVRGWYTCDVGVRYAGAWSYASSIT